MPNRPGSDCLNSLSHPMRETCPSLGSRSTLHTRTESTGTGLPVSASTAVPWISYALITVSFKSTGVVTTWFRSSADPFRACGCWFESLAVREGAGRGDRDRPPDEGGDHECERSAPSPRSTGREVGAHSKTHPKLANLPRSGLVNKITPPANTICPSCMIDAGPKAMLLEGATDSRDGRQASGG